MALYARSLVAASAVSALAACSGVSHLTPAAGSFAAPAVQHSGMLRATVQHPSSSTALLYIGAGSVVNIYDQAGNNQKPIDMLTESGYVGGVHVAPNGDVSVSDINADTISMYHQGAHTPFKQLTRASNPGRIAVDSKGTVYVNDVAGTDVTVYANGSTTPTSVLTDSFGCYSTSVATDASDDLFVSSECGVIDEFLAGQTTPTVLGNGFGFAADIAVDSHQNLVVIDQTANDHELSLYAPPYKHSKKQVNEGTDFIYAIALGAGDTALWFTDSTKRYGGHWAYPGLKRSPNHTSSQGLVGYTLYGLAVYPPGTN